MKTGAAALILLGATIAGNAPCADLSTLQTAVQLAKDEMEKAQKERDADARRVAKGEKDLEELKSQLDADRKKASQSAARHAESRKKYDKAQAALDKGWRK
jgi:Skp family chaperone for outer membrane proteins